MYYKNFKSVLTLCLIVFWNCLTPAFAEGPIKILAIGNSFSEDAVESYVDDLAKSSGIDVIIGNMYIGGCSLETHWNNANNGTPAYSYRKIVDGVKTTLNNKTLKEAIMDENWDFITFQQVSQYSGKYVTYFPYLPNLMNYVKNFATNPNVQYCLHRTWAYSETSTHSEYDYYQKNQMIMYDSIVAVTNKVAEQVGINIIIPVGTAIQNGRSSYIGDNFNRDGYHLTIGLGRFTASCVWYEKLLGKSVLDNTFVPSGVSADEAIIAKNAAHFAILYPDEITSMVGFAPEVPTELNKNININFGNATTSLNWNNIISIGVGQTITNLVDNEGKSTGISIVITDAFGGINTVGPSATTTSFNIPASVSQSSFWGNAGEVFQGLYEPTAGLKISGLDKNREYDFNFLSARSSVTDNRETTFTVVGENEGSATVNASNNTSKIATIAAIKPKTDGTISINIRPGTNNNNVNKFFYLNALIIVPVIQSAIKTVKSSEINVYPNPIKSLLNIESESELGNIEIISLMGEKIFQEKNITEKYLSIDLNWLGKGYYVLKTKKGSMSFIKN